MVALKEIIFYGFLTIMMIIIILLLIKGFGTLLVVTGFGKWLLNL